MAQGADGTKLSLSGFGQTDSEQHDATRVENGALVAPIFQVSELNATDASPARDSRLRMNRRAFLQGAVAGATTLAWPLRARADAGDLGPVRAQVEKRHDEALQRLQEWIRQPSIAAENKGVSEGCDLTMRLLRDAGFSKVTKIPTDGQPGILATLDAGAPRTVGVYFMYDVKHVDPAEWSSPPWAAALVEKPGVGKVLMGRGAVNQKGPQSSLLAALHAIRGAGRSAVTCAGREGGGDRSPIPADRAPAEVQRHSSRWGHHAFGGARARWRSDIFLASSTCMSWPSQPESSCPLLD